MSDVVERARTLLEGVTRGPWQLELVDGKPVEHQHYQYDSMDEWYDVDGPNDGWLAHCQDVADARFIAAARSLVPELVAEVERLHSWDGLMSLLDEHYPEDIFPTEEDNDGRDPGPRIVSLIRQLERLRQQRTITTAEQLDALPDDAVVLADDTPARKHMGDWYFANDDGDGYGSRSLALYLPARLLWLPEWGNK